MDTSTRLVAAVATPFGNHCICWSAGQTGGLGAGALTTVQGHLEPGQHVLTYTAANSGPPTTPLPAPFLLLLSGLGLTGLIGRRRETAA